MKKRGSNTRTISGTLNWMMTGWANHQKAILALALLAAILLPLCFTKRYVVTIMTNCVCFSILALSLNLITGFMGITSMGHAAFYGIGAYTAAILSTRFDVNILVTVPAAILVTALAAFLIGLPAVKVPSTHLAIITLGFCEIMRIIEINWMALTNGPLGISKIPYPTLLGYSFRSVRSRYYLGLVLLVIVFYITRSLVNSRVGRAVISIRENEIAAEAMGVNTYYYSIA